MLSDSQLGEFRRLGHVRIPAAVDHAAIEEMQGAVWRFLESRGVPRGDPDRWPDRIDRLQPLRRQQAFDAFTPKMAETSDQLIGLGKWTALGGLPQALLSLPNADPWALPHKVWHFDLPARGPTDTLGAARYLGFVDVVEPRGGGTLVVEGSHTLVQRMVQDAPHHDAGSSATARKQLARWPFFTDLATPGKGRIERLMVHGDTIDGVDVRVAELTGRAGDLVVMHPWLMHNISMNCSARPRMMMSHTHYATGRSWF